MKTNTDNSDGSGRGGIARRPDDDAARSRESAIRHPQSAIGSARNPESPVTWRAAYLLASFAVFLADQATKAWAVRRLRLGQDITVIPGFFDLAYAENPGIAFGQFQEGGAWGRWLLVALAVAATLAVLTYFWRTPREDDRVLGACALLLAGILGNVTDRARLGHVVDFISLHAGPYYWPNFNIADAAICTGAGLLALDLLLEGRRQKAANKRRGAEAHSP
ncbi:MAG TPA: signal peptidase II [Pyrinomonadaceae bacterium]|nr:signal peptidase II [Pyrinomonadaceae bacterium]